MEHMQYSSFGECIRLANEKAEVVITTEVGPRIIRYALHDRENILAELPTAEVSTSLGVWKPFGGHRLWVAPEVMPNTYYPDNNPVIVESIGKNSVSFLSPTEKENGVRKNLQVSLLEGSHVRIEHIITNVSSNTLTLAPWALTIMRGGGCTIIPQEPFISHDDYLLPARPLVLWYFTDLTDPRITLGKHYVQLRTDEALHHPQKLGMLNKQGWAGYYYNDLFFLKTIDYSLDKSYPDYNSNTETYTAGMFMELESLGPLTELKPNESVTHVEEWYLLSNVQLNTKVEEEMRSELSKLIEPIMIRSK